VFISYYVFVVPILLIVQAFRNRTAAKQQQAAAAPGERGGLAVREPGTGYPNPQPNYPAQPGVAAQPPAPAPGPAEPMA